MFERDALLGLVLVAFLAQLLPTAVRLLDALADPTPTVITARARDGDPETLQYSWSPQRAGKLPSDGWVLAPDETPVAPISGWRGLLLGHPLDLNTATAGDLQALPGIGPVLAARVIEDRAANGLFQTVEGLRRVRGIGPKTLQRLRPLVAAESDGSR